MVHVFLSVCPGGKGGKYQAELYRGCGEALLLGDVTEDVYSEGVSGGGGVSGDGKKKGIRGFLDSIKEGSNPTKRTTTEGELSAADPLAPIGKSESTKSNQDGQRFMGLPSLPSFSSKDPTTSIKDPIAATGKDSKAPKKYVTRSSKGEKRENFPIRHLTRTENMYPLHPSARRTNFLGFLKGNKGAKPSTVSETAEAHDQSASDGNVAPPSSMPAAAEVGNSKGDNVFGAADVIPSENPPVNETIDAFLDSDSDSNDGGKRAFGGATTATVAADAPPSLRAPTWVVPAPPPQMPPSMQAPGGVSDNRNPRAFAMEDMAEELPRTASGSMPPPPQPLPSSTAVTTVAAAPNRKQLMNRVVELMTNGDYAPALALTREAIQANKPGPNTELCVYYAYALEILLRMRAAGVSAGADDMRTKLAIAFFSATLAEIPLLPIHRIQMLTLAAQRNAAAGNFGLAASYCQVPKKRNLAFLRDDPHLPVCLPRRLLTRLFFRI